jgi:hypothetical protein
MLLYAETHVLRSHTTSTLSIVSHFEALLCPCFPPRHILIVRSPGSLQSAYKLPEPT